MSPADGQKIGGQGSSSGANALTSYTIRLERKFPNAVVELKRRSEFSALVKLVTHLEEHPDTIHAAWAMIENGGLDANNTVDDEEQKPEWDSSYTRLGKLPKYWLGENLILMSKKELTPEDIKAIDRADGDALRRLHDMATFTTASTALPKDALNKVVCRRMLVSRAEQCGDLMVGWKAIALKGGTLDELAGGTHTIAWEEGKAKCLKHISGDTVEFDDSVNWNIKKAMIQDNLHHHTASLKQGMSEVLCYKCFPVGRGSNRFRNKKGDELKAIVAAEVRMLADDKDAGKPPALTPIKDSEGTTMSEMLTDNLATRRAQAAKKRAGPSGAMSKKRTVVTFASEAKAAASSAAPEGPVPKAPAQKLQKRS